MRLRLLPKAASRRTMRGCGRRLTIGLSALVMISLFAGCAGAQWNDPTDVNKLVTEVNSPFFQPGESATISFVFTNPFEHDIVNATLVAEPYLLIEGDGRGYWQGVVDPPVLSNSTSESNRITIDQLPAGQNLTAAWTISSKSSTTHGGVFSQSVYYVRLSIRFSIAGDNASYTSRGFFSDEQWQKLTHPSISDSMGGINGTYLTELGYDGIIPDTSFIIREEIPIWPPALILAIAAVTGIMGIFYHLKRNPSEIPSVLLFLERVQMMFRESISRIKSLLRRK